MRKIILWVSAALFSGAVPGAGPIYQWQDESGQRHYGDRPPLYTEAEKRTLASGPTSAGRAGAGLRPGERQRLKRLREEARRSGARRTRRQARSAGEWRQQAVDSDTGACRDLKGRIRDYTEELRRGCLASRCEDLKWERREARRELRAACG